MDDAGNYSSDWDTKVYKESQGSGAKWANAAAADMYDNSKNTVNNLTANIKNVRDDALDVIVYSTGKYGLVGPMVVRQCGAKMPSYDEIHEEIIKETALKINYQTAFSDNVTRHVVNIYNGVCNSLENSWDRFNANFDSAIKSRKSHPFPSRGCDY